MLNSTLPPAEADTGEALTELARFFAVAAGSTQMCPMFSTYIDQAWHTLFSTPDSYAQFSRDACGQILGHQASLGDGRIPWVPDYEARFGNSLSCGSPMRAVRSTKPRTPPTERLVRFSIPGIATRPPTRTTNNKLLARATPKPRQRDTVYPLLRRC
jgi:hypothetical protein